MTIPVGRRVALTSILSPRRGSGLAVHVQPALGEPGGAGSAVMLRDSYATQRVAAVWVMPSDSVM